MTSENADSFLQELTGKEEWAKSTAALIAEKVETRTGPIDYGTALKGARFASQWIDEFKDIVAGCGAASEGSLGVVIERARQRALAKTEGVDRYPTGVPTLKTTIAAWYAFSLSFGNEAQRVFDILSQPPEG